MIKKSNMENVEDLEKNTKQYDSAYSYSCSYYKSTCSSKSDSLSETNSSRSSGYHGKYPTTEFSKDSARDVKEPSPAKGPEVVQVETKPEDLENNDDTQITDRTPPEIIDNVSTPPHTPPGEVEKVIENLDKAVSVKRNTDDNGFLCVISMDDGVVLYTTESISTSLGFPSDVWIGKSFIDFLHPEDRIAFTSQISDAVTLWKNVNTNIESPISTVSYRLRCCQLMNSRFVRNHVVTYVPLHLKFFFKNIGDDNFVYMIIQAKSFRSAYKISNEKITNPLSFVMKHSTNGNLKFFDRGSISYLGYLPQDLIDKDILLLYHPFDLDYLYQVYQNIVKKDNVQRGETYRMLAQNGHYIKVETEWFSLKNPWSGKLEYVIGKHYVVEGPTNPNVFDPPDINAETISEENKTKFQGIRDNIKMLLNEALPTPKAMTREQMDKRFQDIADFMEGFNDKVSNCKDTIDEQDKFNMFNNYYLNTKLGSLSQHESKKSNDESNNYVQLNYNDTLQRYFNTYGQGECSDDVSSCLWQSNDNILKGQRSPFTSNVDKVAAIIEKSLAASSPASSRNFYRNRDIWLTETLLNKHNEKMEQEFVHLYKSKDNDIEDDATQQIKEHLARCNASFEPTSAGLSDMDIGSLSRNESKTSKEQTSNYLQLKYNDTFQRSPFDQNVQRVTAIIEKSLATPPGLCRNFNQNSNVWMSKTLVNKHHEKMEHDFENISSQDNDTDMADSQQIIKHLTKCNESFEPATAGRSEMSKLHALKKNENKIKLSSCDEMSNNTDGQSSFSSFYSSVFRADFQSTGGESINVDRGLSKDTRSTSQDESKMSNEQSSNYGQMNYNDTLQRPAFDSNVERVTAIIEKSLAATPGSSRKFNQNSNVLLAKSLINKPNEKMEQDFVNIYKRQENDDDMDVSQQIKEHLGRCNASFEPTSAGHSDTIKGIKRPLKQMDDTMPHKAKRSICLEDSGYYYPLAFDSNKMKQSVNVVPYMQFKTPVSYSTISELPYTNSTVNSDQRRMPDLWRYAQNIRSFSQLESKMSNEPSSNYVQVNTYNDTLNRPPFDVNVETVTAIIEKSLAASSSDSSRYMNKNSKIWLTEKLLNKHNAKMEQEFIKNYKNQENDIDKDTSQQIKEHLARCNASFEPTSAGLSDVDTYYLNTKLNSLSQKKSNKSNEQSSNYVQGNYNDTLQRSAFAANVDKVTAILEKSLAATSPGSRRNFAQNSNVRLTETDKQAMEEEYVNIYKSQENDIEMDVSQQIKEHLARCNSSLESTSAGFSDKINGRKRPMKQIDNPMAYKNKRSARRKRSFDINKTKQSFHTLPYMQFKTPVAYSTISELPYTLEQSCTVYIDQRRMPGMGGYGQNKFQSLKRDENKITLQNSDGTSDNTDEKSSFSSFYSSTIKADSGSGEDSKAIKVNRGLSKIWQRKRLLDNSNILANWRSFKTMKRMEEESLHPDIAYKYKLVTKNMDEVLSADREKIETLAQPSLVNEQLGQMYLDLQLEGVTARLTLEEGITSCSSSGEEMNNAQAVTERQKMSSNRRRYNISKTMMVHEENAPLPPPDAHQYDATS